MVRYSIIIPTYNRAESLIRSLDSVVNQTVSFDEYEILIIDDGSTDDTETKITNYKLQITKPEIKYFKIGNSGSAAARNFGIKRALGEIIFFHDDDTIVPTNWIEAHAAVYEKYLDAVGVGGWHKYPVGTQKFFQRTANAWFKAYGSYYSDEIKVIRNFTDEVAVLPNVSYKKDVLEKVGGFDKYIPWLSGPELKYRLMIIENLPIYYAPTTAIHNCPLGFWGYWKKIYNQGRCKAYLEKKYVGRPLPLSGDTRFVAVPRRLFVSFARIWNLRGVAITDKAAFFVLMFVEIIMNAAGGFYERYSAGVEKSG